MKKLILIPIFLCAAATSGFAQSVIIPQVMAFQGYVTDADTAFTDTVGQTIVVVNLYDSAAGGNEVWSDTWDTVHVFRGYYTVTLDLSIAAGHWQGANSGFTKQYWLDAIVKGNHLTPKVQLTSAAYSFRAQVADSARVADTANVADTALHVASSVPIGTVVAYAGTQQSMTQSDWMICDGSSISATLYPNYASAFESIYGDTVIGGAPFVFLPDYRGMFLRGVNTGPAGNRIDSFADPDVALRVPPLHGTFDKNNVGSFQPDAVGPHQHIMPVDGEIAGPGGAPYGEVTISNSGYVSTSTGNGGATLTSIPNASGSYGPGFPKGSASTETRPKNAYVYWIIKVK